MRPSATKLLLSSLTLAAFSGANVRAQTSFTSTSATTAWNAARWNNSTDAAPYTSTFTANNDVSFTSGNYSFAGMGATVNVGNVTVADGVTVNFASIGSTYATGGAVRTFDIGSGAIFDLNGNSFSTAAGTGIIKTGSGVFGTGAGAFTGGFTLNAGTVIARGTTGLGSGGTNILTLNGGTLASNATRSFDNTRFGGGIVIGGNVQFGELATIVSLASSSANLSFANTVSLGGATRTFTQGNNGTNTFSGVISNTSGGLIFAANANTDGRFEITNAANTFTGDININGGEVRFTTDGSLGNSANDIIIDGGRFATGNSATYALGGGRQILVGDNAGTSISTPGTGTLTYNDAIANKTGETGSWAKQGGGTLELGGVSTYTGSTSINNGILRLTTGDNRLPAGTVLSLGQAASANLGTLDLNGRSQEIAGLSSTSGTNATASNNTVTSATAATLTLNVGGSNNFVFGDGTNANSGVITGTIALVKTGTGTQTLGDANTFDGGTTLSGGTLALTSSGSLTRAGANATVVISGDNTTLSNAGSITQTGTGRGLDVTANNLTIAVANSGTITTVSTDAFRVNAANTAVSLNNSGTISVTAGGEAVDWSAINTAANSLTNQSGGIISAVGGDAVRPGMNGVVNNAGTITATPTITLGAASGSDGIDLRTQKIVTVTNSGTISGRHGIATDGANVGPSSLTVFNNAGGTITAVNGSGLNVDGVSTSVLADVTNAFGATIQGGVLAAADNGDGDGVDIDGILTLTNSGNIFGFGAKGVGGDTLPNNAQAVSIGGGTIINTATGQIIGSTLLADAPNGDSSRAGEGILADDSSGGSALTVTTVTNSGLIQGKAGPAIRFVGTFGDTITNNAGGIISGAGVGAAIQTGDGADLIINRGSLIGDNGLAINLQDGDDTLTIEGGVASITGDIDGGTGTNTFNFDPGTANSFSHSGTISNFNALNIQSGTVTLSGTNTNIVATNVNGGTLVAGSLGAFGSGPVTLSTGATLSLGGLNLTNAITNNGGTITGASGSANITQSGGTINGSLGGTVSASGTIAGAPTFTGTLRGTATFTGAVIVDGVHAPGNSPGIETFEAGLSYGSSSVLEWEFVGDTLAIRGIDFDGVDVTGGAFSIASGASLKLLASAVDYSTAPWDSIRIFTIVDNSGSGTTTGDFALDTSAAGAFGGQGTWGVVTASGIGGDTVLTWTPVPEPSTYAALAGLAVLGFASYRRRKS